jgi:chemotaxis protein CheD
MRRTALAERGPGYHAEEAIVPPPSLPDYEHIQRFHDARLGKVAANILPGEYYATIADELVTTTLGSCVAACVWDPAANIGGMNHFMIPNAGRASSTVDQRESARYGLFAMEFLINSILRNGGERHRLVAKLAGGGSVLQGSAPIGAENVRFARNYLADENIELISEHVEGDYARRVAFHPTTGRCRVQELTKQTHSVVESEREYATSIERTSGPGDIELF